MSTFHWLRINNKYDFQLTNRFAQRDFFKFFITKVRTDELAVILILLPFKSLLKTVCFISESFALNLFIFVASTNKKLLLPLECTLWCLIKSGVGIEPEKII